MESFIAKNLSMEMSSNGIQYSQSKGEKRNVNPWNENSLQVL